MSRAAALAGLVLLLGSCSAARPDLAGVEPAKAPAAGGTVSVRVTFRGTPVPDARVTWFRSPAPGEAPVAAAATARDGVASFALAPGRYVLVAQWRADGDHGRAVAPGDRFGYFGANPVYLAGESAREIYLSVEEFAAPRGSAPAPAGTTGVAGFVLSDGAPVPDAHVSAYVRPEGGFREQGFASAPTGDDGGFALDLPPGRYFLVVRKRAAGGAAGPMRKGDSFGYYAANPVTVEPSRLTPVVIPVTVLKFRNAPSYSDASAAAVVAGRILGRDGKPRRGVYAALYDNPELLNRPVFLSDVSGDDGRYTLPVPAPGRYFLGARNGYGGSPAPGDLYGRFERTPDHSIEVRAGDRLTGIDIVVDEVR